MTFLIWILSPIFLVIVYTISNLHNSGPDFLLFSLHSLSLGISSTPRHQPPSLADESQHCFQLNLSFHLHLTALWRFYIRYHIISIKMEEKAYITYSNQLKVQQRAYNLVKSNMSLSFFFMRTKLIFLVYSTSW